MSSSGQSGRPRNDGGMLEGSWLWIALPVGVLGLIAALWFLVIAPAGTPPRVTATPVRTPTAGPTVTLASIPMPTREAEPTAAATDAPTTAPTAMPTTIGVGARVEVTGTGASQLSVRQSASTSATRIKFVPDGTKFVVVGGPEQANGYTWWKVDDQAGTVGWAAGQYLALVQ